MGIIAWTDIETTGINEWQNDVVEIAFVLTSASRLTVIARRTWIIQPPDLEACIARMRVDDSGKADDYVFNMHTENGLIDALRAGEGVPIHQAQEEIVAFLRAHSPGRPGLIPMGGSGVERFESRWFEAKLPLVKEALHYWGYDIGCVRRIAKLGGVSTPAEVSVARSGTHRADSDIQQHIDETLWFMRFFSMAKKMGVIQALAREDAMALSRGETLDESPEELES